MVTPPVFTFDYTAFTAQYPEFSNATTYPEILLQNYWNLATGYISTANYGWLNGPARLSALNMMTAHVTQLATNIKNKLPNVLAKSGTIDRMSTTIVDPPVTGQFSYWLNKTPYGEQLLSILEITGVGGFYVGGFAERSAIRKVGGVY